MAASETSDGPVLSLMNKRLRALRKKHNRILQLEDSLAQGKPLIKEQEDLLRSKPALSTLIDEYERLRQPLSVALQEELSLAATPETNTQQPISAPPTDPPPPSAAAAEDVIEDLLKLVYFGCLFDVKPQSEFTSTMLTRTHERGCCLTYDYVTDDATADLLGERDLDLISMLGGLVTSRPVHSGVSHKNALLSCIEHAKLWLSSSDQPVQPGAAITYAGLRERLNKILASDYFTTTPELKAPVDVAAAAGKYATSQVPVQDSTEASPPSPAPGVESEGALGHYQHKDEEAVNFEGNEAGEGQSTPVDEPTKVVDEATVNPTDDIVSEQQDQQNKAQADAEHDERGDDGESKDQQYFPRRAYQNSRGGGRGSGGGGRRGFPNGRGGRGGRGGGGGGYQNGRNQYYDQGNYYPRNYYNARGRGSGKGASGTMYSNHGGGGVAHSGHGPADVELGSAS